MLDAQRLDPVDGHELWRVDTLATDGVEVTGRLLLSGTRLLDTDADGTRTRWVDLADGTPGPVYTGEHPMVTESGVGVVAAPTGLRGIDLFTGTPLWNTPMRAAPWDVFRERDAFTDEDWLVIDGRLGVEPQATRWVCAVDLATGLVRGFAGNAVGYDRGQVLTSGFAWDRPTEYTLALVGLG